MYFRSPTTFTMDAGVTGSLGLSSLFILVAVLAVPSLRAAEPGPEDGSLVIAGATLIDGTGAEAQQNVTVHIREGLIERVEAGSNSAASRHANVVDGRGKFLIPGLVDAHTHIDSVGGVPLSEEEQALVRKYYPRAFLYHGVTTVINLSAHDTDAVLSLRNRVRRSPDVLAPRIFTGASNFTVVGGWSGRHGGGLRSEDEIKTRLANQAEQGVDLVKIINEDGLGEEPIFRVIPQTYMEEIARVSGRYELPVFIHATDREEYARAIAVEPRGIVHGLFTPVEPGDSLFRSMREEDIFVVPTIVLFEAFVRYRDRPELLNDPLIMKSVPDFVLQYVHDQSFMEDAYRRMDEILRMDSAAWARKAVRDLKANTRRMAEAGVRMAAGTDSGGAVVHAFQGYATPREVELLADCCLSPMDAIVAATRTGAEMIGAGEEIGTIEAGKSADILILNSNPLEDARNVRDFDQLILRGRLIDRETLSYQHFAREVDAKDPVQQ